MCAETPKQRARRRLDEYYQAIEAAKQSYAKKIENSEADTTPPPGLKKRKATQRMDPLRRFRAVRLQRIDRRPPTEKAYYEAPDGPEGRNSSKLVMGLGMMKVM